MWKISLKERVDEKDFSHFTGINFINGEVILNNWNSFNSIINPDTGEILNVDESR